MTASEPRFDRIYLVGHAHLDPVWLWRWTEGYQEARATLHAAVKLLAEKPDYVFTFEQMAVVDWIRESDPDLFEQLRLLVKEGRIALVGGWWVEPDCNLPSLESFVRQGLLGQRYLLEHFGGISPIALMPIPSGTVPSCRRSSRGSGLTGIASCAPARTKPLWSTRCLNGKAWGAHAFWPIASRMNIVRPPKRSMSIWTPPSRRSPRAMDRRRWCSMASAITAVDPPGAIWKASNG